MGVMPDNALQMNVSRTLRSLVLARDALRFSRL
jgi:hypothetical protein